MSRTDYPFGEELNFTALFLPYGPRVGVQTCTCYVGSPTDPYRSWVGPLLKVCLQLRRLKQTRNPISNKGTRPETDSRFSDPKRMDDS